ncbi:MAG: hypothetical protein ACRDVE_14825 [Actinocrinis sp.]
MTVRLRTIAPVLAAFAAAVLAAPAASADPVQDPIPVGPNMYFTASVNPNNAGAVGAEPVIRVVCPGPITPYSTGHPLAGQYVEVQAVAMPVSSVTGYTGSAAREIDAIFSSPATAAANAPIVLKSFFAPVEIPATLNLPCGGSGVVSFVPIPTSWSAHGVAVDVQFLNIAL